MEVQTAPPALSTPESHLFEDPTPPSFSANLDKPRLTDVEICEIYEVERTANEVLDGGWRRVALQFPDHMLVDATRVFEALEQKLVEKSQLKRTSEGVQKKENTTGDGLETDLTSLTLGGNNEPRIDGTGVPAVASTEERIRLYILADTSYGSCCVDEIAAEHVDAEAVVHYGRSCLSPTARLPVIYVFTSHVLDLDAVVAGFEETFGEAKEQKIILMADIAYHNHIPPLAEKLKGRGWLALLAPGVIHDPESVIPNRAVPEGIGREDLKDYKMFHLSEPPNALVLTLFSRVGEFFVYPTSSSPSTLPSRTKAKILDTTQILLRRRYALLTHLSTVPVIGILINTLSIKSYLSTLSSLTSLLQKHGKKHYTFVVGKVNAAKMANFAEIGGWVVVGCWEGSLFDSSTGEGFFRGVVTPFELGLALDGDGWRVRGGEWKSSLEEKPIEEATLTNNFVAQATEETQKTNANSNGKNTEREHIEVEAGDNSSSESESEPPEYDFRTGRYITSSRSMRSKPSPSSAQATSSSSALAKRNKHTDLATVNGVLSPGAEFLRSQRTWAGLGSDFERQEGQAEGEGGSIEEGRRGIARGYAVGDDVIRH